MAKKENDYIINGVSLPEPTAGDETWAKKISGKNTTTVNEALEKAVLENQLWRIYFITRHIDKKEGRIFSRGASETGICHAYCEALYHGKLEAFKLLQDQTTYFYKKRVCQAIQRNQYQIMHYLIKDLGRKSCTSIEDAHGSSLLSAVQSKNLKMVQLVVENGGNLVKSGDQAMELARELGQPSIARYLKTKKIQLYADCDLTNAEKIKAVNPQTANAQPQTADNDNYKNWRKLGPETIARQITLNDRQDTLTHVFDFQLQQLTRIFKDANGTTSAIDIKNFKDIEGQNALQDIRKLLIKLKGAPRSYALHPPRGKTKLTLPTLKNRG